MFAPRLKRASWLTARRREQRTEALWRRHRICRGQLAIGGGSHGNLLLGVEPVGHAAKERILRDLRIEAQIDGNTPDDCAGSIADLRVAVGSRISPTMPSFGFRK